MDHSATQSRYAEHWFLVLIATMTGDQRSEKFLEAVSDRLERIARRILDSKARLRYLPDVLQEARIRILQDFRRSPTLGYLPERGSPDRFINAVLRNACLKGWYAVRRNNRPPPDCPRCCVSILQTSELAIALQEVLRTLEAPYSHLLRMRFFGNDSVREIAREFGWSLRTTYRRLDEAKDIVKNRLRSR